MYTSKRGFTLIEILTVVAVITILGSFSLVAIGQARVRARDDQRIRDIKLIQSSLELYRIDIDRSTDAADAGKYAYPVKTTVDDLGIYGDPRFAKYLTKTPVDPLRKGNYVYYAPACLRPILPDGSGSVVVAPSRDRNFHTYTEIRAQSTLPQTDPARYCPQGTGWLPYVIYGVLERSITGKSRTSSLASLANSTAAVAHSITKPIFVTDTEATNTAYQTSSLSYCYPAVGSCSDGFNAQTSPSPSTGLPSTAPSSNPSTAPSLLPSSPSPSPSTSTSIAPASASPAPGSSPLSFP